MTGAYELVHAPDPATPVSRGGAPACTPAHHQRQCCDFQIISHIPFAAVVVLSIYREFYEMTVLVGLVLVTSLLYHIHAEERTACSYVDNVTAFTLSVYGNVQLFFSPSALVLGVNLSLGLCSALIFVLGYTHTCLPYYSVLHPIGLHIMPAAWSAMVVLFQEPLVL